MNFQDVLTAAVVDFCLHGFDSEIRLQTWMSMLRAAAYKKSKPINTEYLTKSLAAQYVKTIKNVPKVHKQIPLFTVERVKPKLRAELDRRIMASSQLIKLNREAAIEKTLQRFSGWSTSIPAGGSNAVEKQKTKKHIATPIRDLSFIDRRVAIDQGHKLIGNINAIIAEEGGAIAGIWNSHWRREGYDYRHSHKERDLKIYTIRNNWAIKDGLMKVGSAGYTDEITMVGEEVYCSCYYQYIYHVSSLPPDMITQKYRDL